MTIKPPFGRPMRDANFLFSPSYTPINHGSFGAYPIPVQATQNHFTALAHSRPDTFIVYDLPSLIDESRTAVAPLLGAGRDEVVFVPNATTGINTVLRNIRWEDGDRILYFSTIYDACEKSVASVGETSPLRGEKVALEYPIEDDEILRRFREGVERVRSEGRKVRMAMFDTVLTFPGVRMPWERLVETCREAGILSLIDGAHGIGHIDLTHLGRVSPDFFVSNCHKWLYTPRSCAVFYVPFRNQHLIRTSIPTSHGYQYLGETPSTGNKTPFVFLFEFVATIDYTPYLCINSALSFRDKVCGGEETIRNYCFKLARLGGGSVAEILGTEVMDNETKTLSKCSFANVRLPIAFKSTGRWGVKEGFEEIDSGKIAKWLNITAFKEHDIYLQLALVNGALWVRLSAQIYLEMGDFEWVGLKLNELCNRVRNGEV